MTMLEINDINVFIGKKKIIKQASFNVGSGAIVGLIGPNGAGKTTIMKTILGLTKFKGRIAIAGQRVTERRHAALLKVGALIEHPAIYPFLTGFQNLKLYSEDELDMQRLIKQLKMEKYIGNKAKGYSLGMKQKLGIAIALLNHPQLVILDEPMNGLDVEATILVRNLIRQYAEAGTSFLISSHILSELEKVVSNVVLIEGGKILITDSIKNFNRANYDHYHLATDDSERTINILKANRIKFIVSAVGLQINHDELFHVQDLLAQNQIHLLKLIPEVISFEERVIHLLREKRVK